MTSARLIPVLCAALLLGAAVPAAQACSIPVFRYALERWQPSPYPVYVFHQGPLAAADQAALDALRAHLQPEAAPLNIEVTEVDLAGEVPADLKELWAGQKDARLPWVVMMYPDGGPQAWAGPLARPWAQALGESPARTELARRLIAGDSAVWVLLQSGDAAKDAAAYKTLADELAAQQRELVLPAPSEEGPQLRSDLPLEVRFPILNVSRTDPAEKALVDLLVASDEAVGKSAEPAVFAVIGRGRALPAIIGGELTAATIADVSAFICGACSCEIKHLNPGFDLLMAANWDAIFEYVSSQPASSPTRELEPPPMAGLAALTAAQPASAPASTQRAAHGPAPTHAAAGRGESRILRNAVIGVVAGALLLLVVVVVLRPRATR